MFCRNCGNEMPSNASVCLKCGVRKNTGNRYCQFCGNGRESKAVLCIQCGQNFNANILKKFIHFFYLPFISFLKWVKNNKKIAFPGLAAFAIILIVLFIFLLLPHSIDESAPLNEMEQLLSQENTAWRTGMPVGNNSFSSLPTYGVFSTYRFIKARTIVCLGFNDNGNKIFYGYRGIYRIRIKHKNPKVITGYLYVKYTEYYDTESRRFVPMDSSRIKVVKTPFQYANLAMETLPPHFVIGDLKKQRDVHMNYYYIWRLLN